MQSSRQPLLGKLCIVRAKLILNENLAPQSSAAVRDIRGVTKGNRKPIVSLLNGSIFQLQKKCFSSSHLVSVVHAKIKKKTYVANLAVDSDSDPKGVPVTTNSFLAKR